MTADTNHLNPGAAAPIAPTEHLSELDHQALGQRARQLTVDLIGEGKRVLAVSPSVETARELSRCGCYVVAIGEERATPALRRYCTAVLRGDIDRFNPGGLLRGRRFDVALLGERLQETADPSGCCGVSSRTWQQTASSSRR